MSFTNLYYKRTTGTAKPCYICFKPTTTVLATINTVDFLYTCDNHLTDRGFASPVGESGDAAGGAKKMELSAEEIAKVKEEYDERQRKKAEKEKEKEEKEKDKEKEGENKEKEAEVKSKTKDKPAALPSTGAATPPKATHERYTLHRDYFAMRLAEHRKRRQTAQAKDLAPRLPGVPKGNVV